MQHSAANALNHYRFAILHSEDGVRLLSYLSREGSASEDELQKTLDEPKPQFHHLIKELFTANLITRSGTNDWAPTTLAYTILAKAGITGVITKHFLGRSRLSEDDRSFLEACVSRKDADTEKSLFTYFLMRSVDSLADAPNAGALDTSERRRLYFAAALCADEEATALGPALYADRITDGLPHSLSVRHQVQSNFSRTCDTALTDVFDCNRYVVTGESSVGKTALLQRLAMARAYAAAASGNSDSTFRPVLGDNSSGILLVISNLESALLRAETRSSRLPRLAPRVRHNIEQLVFTVRTGLPNLRNKGFLVEHSLLPPALALTCAGGTDSYKPTHPVLDRLEQASRLLNNPALAPLNETQRQEGLKYVNEVRRSLGENAVSTGTDDGEAK
jgi:hypothetical protein